MVAESLTPPPLMGVVASPLMVDGFICLRHAL
jgi:hypothetical protein